MDLIQKNPAVKAKHMLLAQDDDQREVHLCDVMSWTDDSGGVQHGISGKLVVTRRFTPSKEIKRLPKFRLTLGSPDARRRDTPQLVSFFGKLRKSSQVCSLSGTVCIQYGV